MRPDHLVPLLQRAGTPRRTSPPRPTSPPAPTIRPCGRGYATDPQRGNPPYRCGHDRRPFRRPHGRLGIVPIGRPGRRDGGDADRRGRRHDRRRRGRRRTRPLGGGLRGVRGGPRPRPGPRGAPARLRAIAFAGLPLVWFAMFERREETVLPEPQDDPAPPPEGSWVPSMDRPRLRRGDRDHPRAHRGRRHVSGQPHAAAALPGRRRRARAVPRPLLRAARRLCRVPEPGPLPRPVGVAGALLRAATRGASRPGR